MIVYFEKFMWNLSLYQFDCRDHSWWHFIDSVYAYQIPVWHDLPKSPGSYSSGLSLPVHAYVFYDQYAAWFKKSNVFQITYSKEKILVEKFFQDDFHWLLMDETVLFQNLNNFCMSYHSAQLISIK